MSDIKVGDKVKIKKTAIPPSSMEIGDVAVVTKVYPDGSVNIKTSETDGFYMCRWEVEPLPIYKQERML